MAATLGAAGVVAASLTVGVQAVDPSAADAANVACPPTAGFDDCRRYTYEGSDQTFVVPKGVTSVEARIWAAAGAGGQQTNNFGGGGGFTIGTVTVTPGETLQVAVGQGGAPFTTTGTTYGGGAPGGTGNLASSIAPGSQGGGYSGLFRGTPGDDPTGAILMAGGGGGASLGGTPGGGGGGLTGDSAATPEISGAGGTQEAGGEGAPGEGAGCPVDALPGTQWVGGRGADGPDLNGSEGGGGGGGGWFGGGGGACQILGPPLLNNGGGGGGSGYVDGAGVVDAETTVGETGGVVDDRGGESGGASDPLYTPGIGTGGVSGEAGGNGEVVVQFELPAPVIDGPADGSTIVDATPEITGTGEPGTVVTVTASDDVVTCAGGPVTVVENGSWTCTPTTALPLGEVSLVADQADPDSPDADYPPSEPSVVTVVAVDLAITKTGPDAIAAGEPVDYTLTATNEGPEDVVEAVIDDTVPAAVIGVEWTCTATGGATCGEDSGSGNEMSVPVDIPVGGEIVIEVSGTTEESTPTQVMNNTAIITPAEGTTDPDESNNRDTASTSVSAPLDACGYVPVELTNGSFEEPPTPAGGNALRDETEVPGWNTTATDNTIEMWGDGFLGVPAADGNAFVELNAFQVSTLYQDLPTVPGTPMNWSLNHRGRDGVDVMKVQIGPVGGPYIDAIPTGQTVPEISDGQAWGFYTGTYEVPADQTVTSFRFVSVTPVGATGNLLDGIRFGSPGCLEATKEVAGPDPVSQGETLTYTITATNPGNTATLDSFVEDVIPEGSTFVPGSITATNPAGSTSPVDDADGFTGDGIRVPVGASGSVEPGDSWEVSFEVTVDADTEDGSTIDNEANAEWVPVAGQDPLKSDPATTSTPVLASADLSIEKTLVSDEPVKPGESFDYEITVTNDGPAAALGVTASDPLPDDLSFVEGESCTADGQSVTCGPEAELAPGDSVSWTFTVELAVSYRGDGSDLQNVATADSETNDPNPDNDASDPLDPPGIPQLDIVKTPGPITPKPGESVTYTVELTNDGTADYTDAFFEDDMSGVIDDATFNEDQEDGGAGGTFDYAEPILRWDGLVPAGETVTITYSATVDTPPGGDKLLANLVEGPPDSNCPPDADDPAPECGGAPEGGGVPQLELEKTVDVTTPVPGEVVTYTVTAENTGTATYEGASFEDDLTEVLDDAAFNDDAEADDGSAVDYAEPVVSWTGDLDAGQVVTITYSLTVDDPHEGDGALANAVTGPDDSNCPPDADDPAPECGGAPEGGGVKSLEMEKTADTSAPAAGDTVTYTVTMTSTGTVDYEGASFTDDLSDVVDDAVYNEDHASDGGGGFTYEEPDLSWSGTVPEGETITITYSATVDVPPGGNRELANAVIGPPGSNCPEDADPVPDECGGGTSDPIQSVTINKTADPENPIPGEAITYTVEVTNTGGAETAAEFSDDLSDVIDDATFNDDAEATGGTVEYTEPTVSWTGDLDVDETATITYSATVDDPPGGNQTLVNKVSSPTPGSNCPEGSSDPVCGVGGDDDDGGAGGIPLLHIEHSGEPESVAVDEDATFTVTVENVSGAPFNGVELVDSLAEINDDGDFNGDAEASDGTVDEGSLIWAGDLAAGESATVTFTATAETAGGEMTTRFVAQHGGTNCPADSDDSDCWATVQIVDEALPDTGSRGVVMLTGVAGLSIAIGLGTLLAARRFRRTGDGMFELD